ncbi:DUF4400 domain-containing protein [Photobacterium damselae]|nr:DUF4400 domain-containing protein [Photobacterium damselae]
MKKDKPFLYFIITIFIQIITVMVLLDQQWMQEITQEEVAKMDRLYSESTTNDVIIRGNDWYMKYIVDTSIEHHFYFALLPEEYLRLGEIPDDKKATWLFRTTEGRINAFLEQVRFSFIRLASMCVWLDMVGLMVIGFIITAYILRQKKKLTYEYTSPLRHEYSKRLIVYIPLITWLAFWFPLAVDPIVYPIFGFIVAACFGLFLSNSAKRI